ncbi:MAG: alpha/beta hydrolase [Anaerolineae bacterium]|nr:alpha/beta hydrolase [Anaerolineae bacterium]
MAEQDWISGHILVNGLKIYYRRTDTGHDEKPVVVFSHGTSDSCLTWTETAQALEEHFDLIMYDRRGHGLSDAPERGYTFVDHAADLVGLIQALKLDQPGVVGHSGGAFIAAIVAAHHPELLSYLVLEDPPWGTGWGDWNQMANGLAAWFRNMKDQSRAELESGCREAHPDWSDALVQAWVTSHVLVSPNVLQEFQQAQMDWRGIAESIKCPTLLLSSDLERNPLLTEDDVYHIIRQFINIRKVRVPDSSHMIHFDNPEKYVQVMRNFLRSMWWSRRGRLSS